MKKINAVKETVKGTCRKLWRKAPYLMAGAGVLCLSVCVSAHAADASGVTDGIKSITTLVTSIVTGIGAIVTVWGIFDFGSAYQHHDSSQQTMAIKKVVAGLIMTFAPQIVNMLI